MEGEVALKRYSNFALSDSEQSGGYSLMCRAMPEQDLVVELLHYDPDNYRLEHAIRDGEATVEAVEALTHDITRLVLSAPGVHVHRRAVRRPPRPRQRRRVERSFSMANLPGDDRIELMIKRYPGGKLSGMLEGQIKPGDKIGYTGPYGSLRARESEHPILMIAGGLGDGADPVAAARVLRRPGASGRSASSTARAPSRTFSTSTRSTRCS